MTTTLPQLEAEIQRQACDYIRLNWPRAIFNSDLAGHSRPTGGETSLRSSRGFPDLQLLVPRGPYHGALWEAKRPSDSPFLRDGTLSTDKHVQEQAEVLQMLMNLGYYANFFVGIDDFIEQCNWYMAH